MIIRRDWNLLGGVMNVIEERKKAHLLLRQSRYS
jgi:hypothetical protein